MITRLDSKKTVLMIMIGLSMIACKKKEEPAAAEPVAETPAPCFNSNYNGTYVGSGYVDNMGSVSTYTTGTVTIGKTGCQTANISITTGSIFKSEQLSQLVLNSSGGYDGKLANGNNVTLVLGSVLQLKAVGSFTFTGPKQ